MIESTISSQIQANDKHSSFEIQNSDELSNFLRNLDSQKTVQVTGLKISLWKGFKSTQLQVLSELTSLHSLKELVIRGLDLLDSSSTVEFFEFLNKLRQKSASLSINLALNIRGEVIRVSIRGSGEKTLLLLHPFFGDRYYFDPISPYLEKDFCLIIPEMRGHGQSSWNEPISDLEELVKDTQEIIKQLGLIIKDKCFTIVGACLGSGIGLKLLQKNPDMYHNLIIVSPFPCVGMNFTKPKFPGSDEKVFYESIDDVKAHPIIQLHKDAINGGNKEAMRGLLEPEWLKAEKKFDQCYYDIILNGYMNTRGIDEFFWTCVKIHLGKEKIEWKEGDNTLSEVKNLGKKVCLLWGEKDFYYREWVLEGYQAELGENLEIRKFPDGVHNIIGNHCEEIADIIIKNSKLKSYNQMYEMNVLDNLI